MDTEVNVFEKLTDRINRFGEHSCFPLRYWCLCYEPKAGNKLLIHTCRRWPGLHLYLNLLGILMKTSSLFCFVSFCFFLEPFSRRRMSKYCEQIKIQVCFVNVK